MPVPVDAHGIDVARGEQLAPQARLAYVTPCHQFPTGVALSMARRLALLDWAERADAFVLEDDYDSEFAFAGAPTAALHGLVASARVIYVGTFSQSLFPAVRLGYLVLPPALLPAFRAVRTFADGFPPTLLQQAAARVLAEGHFDRHLRQVQRAYGQRREALLGAAARHLPADIVLSAASSGLHAVAWLPPGMSAPSRVSAAAAAGVEVLAVSSFAAGPLPRDGLLLGYAAFGPRELDGGMRRLARVLR